MPEVCLRCLEKLKCYVHRLFFFDSPKCGLEFWGAVSRGNVCPMLQTPRGLRLQLLPRCTPVDSSGNPVSPKPSAFPFVFKEPLSSHLLSISCFLLPSKPMFPNFSLSSLSGSHANSPSFFLHSSSCNSLHPLSLSHMGPSFHSTFSPLHFINELGKQLSIDADGCLSFLKAEVKVQSVCLCVCVRACVW